MPTAVLALPAVPEQARTARLVAGAAARRAGVDPELLDDVRLAVAEAVGLSVETAPVGTAGRPDIEVAMTDDGAAFRIAVTGRGGEAADGEDDIGESLALAVIEALALESSIERLPHGDRVIHLSWPTGSPDL